MVKRLCFGAKGKWIMNIWIVICINTGYEVFAGVPTYTFLMGDTAELPCDLNVSTTEDEVSLVLWHRDESGNPLYSVDARDLPLPSATHFRATHMESRSYFNSSAAPAYLKINDIRKDEEGIYRCRIEYRRARTETMDMMLTVIVPPREAIIMDEFGQHLHGIIGPYNEGQPVSLICEGEGGDPSPSVRWLKGKELLDDTYYVTPQGFARNEIHLPKLIRTDLLTTYTCEVSNSNLTKPVTSTISLDMNLRPTDVRITSPYQPLSAGKDTDIVCVARGARPPAQISWWLDGEKLTTRITESTADEDNLTISSLSIRPNIEDNLKNLSCRGDNPQLTESVLEDTWLINVHYVPRLSLKINNVMPVSEDSDVSMTCEVHSHPPIIELEWLQDGRSLGPPTGPNFSNRTLTIQSVGPQHKGSYQCAGTNSEGRAVSDPVDLKINHAPVCESVRSSVYGVGRTESVSVACAVDAFPGLVNFSWILSNAEKDSPLPPQQFTSNGTKSVATIQPRVPQDYGILKCWASNVIGHQRDPCTFRIIPAGVPEEPKECEVTNRTMDCLAIECKSGEDGGLQQIFQLEVMNAGSDKFLANLTSRNSPSFLVCSLPSKEPLILVIYAVNSKGRSKQVTVYSSTLAGKSQDKNVEAEEDSTIAIIGIIIGTGVVLCLFVIVIMLTLNQRKRRINESRKFSPETEKCDAHLMKECKDPCVTNNHGPDIIPEKSFYQERTETVAKSGESEDDTILSTIQSEKNSRKYGEYQSVIYSEDSELITDTPKKLRILQEIEAEVEDSGITVETPLISSIPTALQQWTDHRKEGLHLSTPV